MNSDSNEKIPLKSWRKTQNVLPSGKENEKVLKKFLSVYNLDRPTSGEICISRLNGKRCKKNNKNSHQHQCGIPHDDHPSLWLRKGEPAVYCSHLYALTAEEAREIAKFCEARELEATFRPALSFWSEKTIAVIVQQKEAVK